MMLLLYCCLLQAKKSGEEQRMCWCLRENSKGGTILSCWLRTIHIYCNLKYVCVCACAHAHVCVAWTCWCEQDTHMCVHVMMTKTGISYCSPFLSPSISWGRISHGTWSSPFGSGYLVPKSPRYTRVANQPFIQHWGYSLCVGFYMGAEGSIADASGCTANTLPMEPTP